MACNIFTLEKPSEDREVKSMRSGLSIGLENP